MHTYSITTVTFQRRSLFVRTANAELMTKIIFHYREQGRFHLHAFVIMPEHLHLLLTPLSGQTVERCVQCIKGGFSFAVRRQFRGEIWQAGFHEHRVRDQDDFARHLNYIAANPHRRGLNDYPYVHIRYPESLDPIPQHLRKAQTSGPKGPPSRQF